VLDPDANGTEQKVFLRCRLTALSQARSILHTGPEGAEFRSFLKETDAKEQREEWEHYIAETCLASPRRVSVHPALGARQAA